MSAEKQEGALASDNTADVRSETHLCSVKPQVFATATCGPTGKAGASLSLPF